MTSAINEELDTIRSSYTEAEWSSRLECAAGHHILELYGLTDMLEGVLAVRVAEQPDAYLLKPYGTFYDEVQASKLVKVCFDEEPDAGPGRPLNYSSCAQAKGILAARKNMNCILHTHIPASTVVASLECGLQAVIQHALIVLDKIAYVKSDISNDDEAVADVVKQMGDKNIAMIRNHGVFVIGRNVAEVIFLTITLEYASRCQLDAMQSNQKIFAPDITVAQRLSQEFTTDPNNNFTFDGSLHWQGWLRKLDRTGACYKS